MTTNKISKVHIGNPGLIDPKAFSIFGLHAKLGDSPIGFFGTGLKYAIAILLREGRELTIHSGEQKLQFHAKEINFRGKIRQQVFCNDTELPFTTEVGKNWKLWQAYRELVSNALDEGGGVDWQPEDPTEPYTRVEVELGDIKHEEVFIDPELKPFYEDEYVAVYPQPSTFVFIRGIRAETCHYARHTYNFKRAQYSEDRQFLYGFERNEGLASYWATVRGEGEIEYILNPPEDSLERQASFCSVPSLSPELQKAIEDNWATQRAIHASLISAYKRLYNKDFSPKAVTLTTKERHRLHALLNEIESFGYPIRQYKVQVAEFLGKNVRGAAIHKKQEIWILRSALFTKDAVVILFEEFVHLKTELPDYTPDLQQWCFTEILNTHRNALKGIQSNRIK